ncbi:MAG TPA: hypothetical protein VFI90_15660 [Rubrobacter sp.]|nr:hypothetical protein [Rubrobacter sp.]
MSVSYPASRSNPVLYAVAAFSLVAALTHLWVMPEHFEEWWGYGTFFLVCAVAQVLYVPVLMRWPTRKVLLSGVVGNCAVVLMYALTRTVGIPLFGPHAGEVEGAGFVDLCATSSELGIAAALGVLLLRNLSTERRIQVVIGATALLVGHLLHLLAGSSSH